MAKDGEGRFALSNDLYLVRRVIDALLTIVSCFVRWEKRHLKRLTVKDIMIAQLFTVDIYLMLIVSACWVE